MVLNGLPRIVKTYFLRLILMLVGLTDAIHAEDFSEVLAAEASGEVVLYFSAADKYFQKLVKPNHINATSFDAASRNLKYFLSYENKNDVGNADFLAELLVLNTLIDVWLSAKNIRNVRTAADLQEMIDVLSLQLKAKKIDDYVRKPTSINIYVPGMMMAGQDPDSITDPKLKAELLMAIKANREAIDQNVLQTEIPKALKSLERSKPKILDVAKSEGIK